MKIKYVMVFGKMKVDIYQLKKPESTTTEEITKAFKKLEEMAKKYGLKMILWGSPLGMNDESVVVFDVGESIDNYLKFIEENLATLPFTNMRTHPIVLP